jgi:hypothetical protein
VWSLALMWVCSHLTSESKVLRWRSNLRKDGECIRGQFIVSCSSSTIYKYHLALLGGHGTETLADMQERKNTNIIQMKTEKILIKFEIWKGLWQLDSWTLPGVQKKTMNNKRYADKRLTQLKPGVDNSVVLLNLVAYICIMTTPELTQPVIPSPKTWNVMCCPHSWLTYFYTLLYFSQYIYIYIYIYIYLHLAVTCLSLRQSS